jgi:acyl carrier protein
MPLNRSHPLSLEITSLEIEATVRNFITDNYLFGGSNEVLGDDASLLENGILDSMGIMELVTFLQDTFFIQVADEELVPQNLDSLRRITDFVVRKLDKFSA